MTQLEESIGIIGQHTIGHQDGKRVLVGRILRTQSCQMLRFFSFESHNIRFETLDAGANLFCECFIDIQFRSCNQT